MAFEVVELSDSRKVSSTWNDSSATLEFFGRGSMDDTTARAGFASVIPTVFMGLLLENISVNPIGGPNWTATATYKSFVLEVGAPQFGDPLPPLPPGTSPPPPPPPAPDDNEALGPEYSFDLSAVTEHITQSKETIHRIKRFTSSEAGSAPDNQRAIGITLDGEVQGVDRFTPYLEWSTTRTWGYITKKYLRTLYSLVGTTNAATFYGWAKGEVLFLGASASIKQKATVTYKFAVSPNLVDVIVCTALDIPTKGGWEYLWVAYSPVPDKNRITMQPDSAYVERIYDEGDFTKIGVGS